MHCSEFTVLTRSIIWAQTKANIFTCGLVVPLEKDSNWFLQLCIQVRLSSVFNDRPEPQSLFHSKCFRSGSHYFREAALKKEFLKLWLRDYPLLPSIFWILRKQEKSQSSTTLHSSLEKASAPLCHRNPPDFLQSLEKWPQRSVWPSSENDTAGSKVWLPPPLPPLPLSLLPPSVAQNHSDKHIFKLSA